MSCFEQDLSHLFPAWNIHKNNLLISKNGAPYKIAVADVPNDKKILANGNLFVIELDLEKINPYYLKAFFLKNLVLFDEIL